MWKLDAPNDIRAAIIDNHFLTPPVSVDHASAVAALPRVHRDPFDRILIAQAKHEGFAFVSRDSNAPLYGAPLVIA